MSNKELLRNFEEVIEMLSSYYEDIRWTGDSEIDLESTIEMYDSLKRKLTEVLKQVDKQ